MMRALCAAAGDDETAACYTLPLPEGQAPEWVMLMPGGELAARDGRRWRLDDAEAVVAETRRVAGATDLVFDYNHQTDRAAKNGQPAPASGWIEALEVRAGAVWGRVRWTDRAKAAIAAREFRYVSPVFTHTRAGRVRCLLRAALLNDPALDLPALAAHNPGGSMHEQLKRILAKLGFEPGAEPTTAEADAALARIDPDPPIDMAELAAALGLAATAKAGEVIAAAKARGADLAKALGLAATATADEVLAAARAKGPGEEPDPAAFVPRSEFDTVAGQLTALQAERDEDKATAAVDEAVAAGKVSPATRAWATAYAKKDLDGFKAYAAAAPAIVAPAAGPSADAGGSADPDAPLSAEEKAVCSQLGITEDAYRKSRAESLNGEED